MVVLYEKSSELETLRGDRNPGRANMGLGSVGVGGGRDKRGSEEWKASIRETVEKAISSKVEQRLDTPPLERMRRKQMEAKMRKEQQMKDLERNMNLSTPNGSSSNSSVTESWKRKFGRTEEPTDAGGDPRYFAYDLSALRKLDRYKLTQGISATVLAEHSASSDKSAIEDSKNNAATTIILPSSISSNQFKVSTGLRNERGEKRSESRCTTDNEGDTFSSSSYETKRRLFRKFSKEGFKDAVRNGSLFPVDKRGLFTDDVGTVLSADGPFWPNGLGPLVKSPKHIDDLPMQTEPLAAIPVDSKQQQGSLAGNAAPNRTLGENFGGRNNINPGSSNNVQYPSPLKSWEEDPILVYDSSRFVTHPVPHELPPGNYLPSLVFESRFESGNLSLAFRTGPSTYELILKADLFTDRHTQWFYFRVSGMLAGETYLFKVINLSKPDSLYNQGMRPLMYSEIVADGKGIGWHRIGHHISYSTKAASECKCLKYCRGLSCATTGGGSGYYVDQSNYAVLQWRVEFPHNADTCYFAHCYPYTFTKLRDFVNALTEKTLNEKILRKESLCETRARNTCYLLTITNQTVLDSEKRGVIVTARVHPGESNSSWMMQGFLEFITSDNPIAQRLRDKFIFKVIPMLNPDGVIVGNYRCSLFGKDLNRNYSKPKREYFPTIWATKQMLHRLSQRVEVVLYVDMHGHSRKQNIFMYGCDSMYRQVPADTSNGSTSASVGQSPAANSSVSAGSSEGFLNERLFPFLMSLKVSDKFSFRGCRFHIRKCKESTGRVVMFRQFNILNSFTMEATFCGTTLNGTSRHFTSDDFKSAGKALAQSLHDYARAMEDESAQSEYILELTRVVAADYLMDVSHRTSTSNSADQSKMASGDVTENSVVEASRTDEDEALSRDILKRQQKLEEISEQLSKSRNLKECFKLLDSLRASAQGRDTADSSDDSDSGDSDSEFVGGDKKKKQTKDSKKKKPTKQPNTSATPQRQSASTSGGLSRNSQPIRALGKDSNSGPTSDEWSKASTNKQSLYDKSGGGGASGVTPLGVVGVAGVEKDQSVGVRAGAVISEYSNSVFNPKAHVPAAPLVPTKVVMRGGAETPSSGVSRSTALNPYANRSGKGLPIFSEERSKEKKLKRDLVRNTLLSRYDGRLEIPNDSEIFINGRHYLDLVEKEPASITSWPTQNLEQAVWGSRIDSSCSHAAEQTVGSQSKSTREVQRASDGGSAIQQVSNNSKLEYISSVKAIPTFSYRPQYLVTEKKVERVVPPKAERQNPAAVYDSRSRPSPHLSLANKQADTRKISTNQKSATSANKGSSFTRNQNVSRNSSAPDHDRAAAGSWPSNGGRNQVVNSKTSVWEKKSTPVPHKNSTEDPGKKTLVTKSATLEVNAADNPSSADKEAAKKGESSRKKTNKSNLKVKAKSPNIKPN